MANDTNVDLSERKKLGEYINRAYKECAKRSKVSLPDVWELTNDEDKPITHTYNDDFIIFYALYLYLTSKNIMDRAEVFKQEADAYRLKITNKAMILIPTNQVY
jgi:hypothetical protein